MSYEVFSAISHAIDSDHIIEQLRGTIKSVELQEVAQAFCQNIENAQSLIVLPWVLLKVGKREAEHLAFMTQAMVKSKTYLTNKQSKEAQEEFQKELHQIVKQHDEDPEWQKHREEDEEKTLKALFQNPTVETSIRVLLYAVLANIWTSFECAAKDTWIAALNARPDALVQRAIRSIPDDGAEQGLTKRSIAVGLLARHNFDVRNCLGSLLSGKFDFTSVTGIQFAYEAAFGKEQNLDLIFGAKPLYLLEIMRHLIVHRAGIVDEKFIKLSGLTQLSGAPLFLNADEFNRMLNTTVSSTSRLLSFVDDWLIKNSKSDA